MRRSQELTRLKRLTAWENDPAITLAELNDLLDMARVPDYAGSLPTSYDEFEPTTVYAVGAVIVPAFTDWTGHTYTVTAGGTTGSGSVTWPTASGATVTSGSVTLVESGVARWVPTYDLNLAAAEGWRWKKAAVAGRVTFTADGATFQRDQFMSHCEAMIQSFAPAYLGSGRIRRHDE